MSTELEGGISSRWRQSEVAASGDAIKDAKTVAGITPVDRLEPQTLTPPLLNIPPPRTHHRIEVVSRHLRGCKNATPQAQPPATHLLFF